MGKRVKELYIRLLKEGWRAEAEMDGDICEVWVLKDYPSSFWVDGHTSKRLFRLYPRNPYTHKFDERCV